MTDELAQVVRVELEGQRFYRRAAESTPHNRPSVTSILSSWTPPALKRWFINKSATEIAKRSEETAKVGSAGHEAIEKHQAGETYEDTPENRSFVERWKGLVTQYDIVPQKQEFMLVSDDYGFGGQLDAEVTLTDNKGCRKKYIADLKTGQTGSAGMQLAAYRMAWKENFDGEIGICCFQIHRDGRPAKAIFYHDPNWWFDSFVGLLVNWRRENFQSLKAMSWNWLEKDFLGTWVDTKRKEIK